MNKNIFWLRKKGQLQAHQIKMGEYKYKYIWVDKKGRRQVQMQIFGLVFANTNTNH